jgi:hypothetical protein
MATRTGVSTLRKLLREICKIVAKFPGLLTDPAVPEPIAAAIIALVAVCVASTFDDPHAGELTGQGVLP